MNLRHYQLQYKDKNGKIITETFIASDLSLMDMGDYEPEEDIAG